jgi:hypothetical protein
MVKRRRTPLHPLASAIVVAKTAAKAAVFLIFSNAFIAVIFLNRFVRSFQVAVLALGRVSTFSRRQSLTNFSSRR